MLYLIKDMNHFEQLQKETNNVLHIKDNNDFFLNDLKILIDEKVYKNIFLENMSFLNFLQNYNLDDVDVYVLIKNISYIKVGTILKSKVVMENPVIYQQYIGEIKKFLVNKSYTPDIPHYLQIGTYRFFIMEILKNIKDKKYFSTFIGEIERGFFYQDIKVGLHMLYILNEEKNFANYI